MSKFADLGVLLAVVGAVVAERRPVDVLDKGVYGERLALGCGETSIFPGLGGTSGGVLSDRIRPDDTALRTIL